MKISYLKTIFRIEALEEINLPYFKGSTFRGVFGNTFKKIVCVLKSKVCDDCILKQNCVYAYIFETPPPAESTAIFNMNKYKNIPHPFIIEPPLDSKKYFQEGEELEFSVILIGKAASYLPYFIYTFSECGKQGIGKGRGRYTLKDVLTNDRKIVYTEKESKIIAPEKQVIEISEDFDETWNSEEEITLNILTPIRLKNRNDLVRNLEFYILIKALMLRMNLLNFFHCEGVEARWNHKKLLDLSRTVRIVEDKTRWYDWERYSSRQQTRIRLGGIVGTIKYGGNMKPFKELLKAGEILHIGKNTTFGLGKYKILEEKNCKKREKM